MPLDGATRITLLSGKKPQLLSLPGISNECGIHRSPFLQHRVPLRDGYVSHRISQCFLRADEHQYLLRPGDSCVGQVALQHDVDHGAFVHDQDIPAFLCLQKSLYLLAGYRPCQCIKMLRIRTSTTPTAHAMVEVADHTLN